jgi:GTP-binding protein
LTNVRNTSAEEAIRLTPHRTLTLEECLGYVAPDEYVEVTPKHLRLRKVELNETKRKSADKAKHA